MRKIYVQLKRIPLHKREEGRGKSKEKEGEKRKREEDGEEERKVRISSWQNLFSYHARERKVKGRRPSSLF